MGRRKFTYWDGSEFTERSVVKQGGEHWWKVLERAKSYASVRCRFLIVRRGREYFVYTPSGTGWLKRFRDIDVAKMYCVMKGGS